MCENPAPRQPTAADVLVLGARILESEGWKRKDWGTFCGPKCADGALVAASVELAGVDRRTIGTVGAASIGALGDALSGAERMKAWLLHSEAFHALSDEVGGSVTVFNDDQRDKRKVIRAMRSAARKLTAPVA